MKSKLPLVTTARLPGWVPNFTANWPEKMPLGSRELMSFAVMLLDEHIKRGTGGPFAAMLVSRKSRRLLSVGLNQVITLNDPTAHAECSAFRFAAPG